jgi:flavin reductase (DIM6/NTAB) family NADH-FMN oxidoreductase RutF
VTVATSVIGPVTDERQLKNAFACFPSGVVALCAFVGGEPVGMAASSFTAVSLEPPLVSVCIQVGSATWRKLESAPRLGVSFLGEAHDGVCRQLAAKTGDRFAGLVWEASPSGALFIDGAAVWLECSVYRRVEAGDHEIVLLQIEQLRVDPEVHPLVFHASRFRQLSRG